MKLMTQKTTPTGLNSLSREKILAVMMQCLPSSTLSAATPARCGKIEAGPGLGDLVVKISLKSGTIAGATVVLAKTGVIVLISQVDTTCVISNNTEKTDLLKS